ncbi:MAG: hypothetical protein JSW61_03730 [Candidatus Thorarchaeota archaeon]|nr:MAG: hypothetical protein JSW61_03730 [Candidatus Thorarchaeota archaeon]
MGGAADTSNGSESDATELGGRFDSFVRLLHRIPEWRFFDRASISLLIVASIATLLSVSHYLLSMLLWTTPGFTLDDSWIHLQFARTIFEGTPWEYSPGYPATGSTSPLWSLILSVLFFFTTDPSGLVIGTYAISTVFYISSTFLVGKIVNAYTDRLLWGFLGSVAFVLVPRNTWLMLSGMETPLFMFMLLLAIYLLDKPGARFDLLLGIVSGLAFLSRPEAILIFVLCVPVRFLFVAKRRELTWRRLASFGGLALLALAVVAPWILYCLSTTGYPLPDTFYAKVHVPTEFEIQAWNTWWGIFLIEMPSIAIGGALGSILLLKGRPFPWLLCISLAVLYRLTTPYAALINNARYLVPIFNLFTVVAIAGLSILLTRIHEWVLADEHDMTLNMFVGWFIIAIIVIPPIGSYFVQAPFYGNAVKNINEQQVHIGLWLRDNTPEDAVLAIHDAGALRFFSNRVVIDLAGLVSPDIIHGNMSSIETLQYLKDQGCEYFVFFDELMVGWSGYLSGAIERIYTVTLPDNVISGRDTMSVFFVNWTRSSFS